jgi:hypothetical protein
MLNSRNWLRILRREQSQVEWMIAVTSFSYRHHFFACLYSHQFWGISPDRALSPKNQTLHFSYQYIQTQSVEQDFVNKNSLFIKQAVKNLNFIRVTIAEINIIRNVRSKFSCKYFQISLLGSRKMMIYLPDSYWLIHPYRASRLLLENWSRDI